MRAKVLFDVIEQFVNIFFSLIIIIKNVSELSIKLPCFVRLKNGINKLSKMFQKFYWYRCFAHDCETTEGL